MSKTPSPSPTKLLTIEDVCRELQTSRTAVYGLLASGHLPYVYLGKHRRIRASDLAAYVASLPVAEAQGNLFSPPDTGTRTLPPGPARPRVRPRAPTP